MTSHPLRNKIEEVRPLRHIPGAPEVAEHVEDSARTSSELQQSNSITQFLFLSFLTSIVFDKMQALKFSRLARPGLQAVVRSYSTATGSYSTCP